MFNRSVLNRLFSLIVFAAVFYVGKLDKFSTFGQIATKGIHVKFEKRLGLIDFSTELSNWTYDWQNKNISLMCRQAGFQFFYNSPEGCQLRRNNLSLVADFTREYDLRLDLLEQEKSSAFLI